MVRTVVAFCVAVLVLAVSSLQARAELQTAQCSLVRYTGELLVYKLLRTDGRTFFEVGMTKDGVIQNNGHRMEYWTESGNGVHWFLQYNRNPNYFLRGPYTVQLVHGNTSIFPVELIFGGNIIATGVCDARY